MMTKLSVQKFERETQLCGLFIKCLPKGWTAYPETGGFDILLSRDEDGFQIGIEAKLRLNAKVIGQVLEGHQKSYVTMPGPDCRAVLVPENARGGLEPVCFALGITPIRMITTALVDGDGLPQWMSNGIVKCEDRCGRQPFRPLLPDASDRFGEWFERCPDSRLKLPDWVPDVVAGDKSPVSLTDWKIKAIKIVITLEKRGFVTRRDFKHFGVSMSRWTNPFDRWLESNGEGGWVATSGLPDFKKQHPVNFSQIEDEYEKWQPPAEASQPGLFGRKAAK